MSKRRKTRADYDSPWKDALQLYLPNFLLFFFPDIHAGIDWSRGYVSLDKKFQQIARRAKVGKRLADKLFKVWLKDGSERWLLIHVEIQGGIEKDFAERMFNYNVSARLLYNHTVVSLAILCDDRADWRPTSFEYGQWGCRLELTFRVGKLLDHANNLNALEASDNPIAAVVLAHLKTQETRHDPDQRRLWKLRIVKNLYSRNWAKEEIRRLFHLIDWIIALPVNLERAFSNDLHDFEEEMKMPHVSSMERFGKEIGICIGLREGIALDLEAKFGSAGLKLIPRIRSIIEAPKLRRLARFIKKTDDLAAIEDRLN